MLDSLDIPASAYAYGARASGETHGVVLTKPHVVRLVLDLAEWTAQEDLGARALLEPSCGRGAFLVEAVDRLLTSAKRFGREPETLASTIAAFDIDPQQVEIARRTVEEVLAAHGIAKTTAKPLINAWIIHGDFLLTTLPPRFTAVVGNPPYVRLEQLAPALRDEYKRRYASLFDRADLYVAFIERGLRLLEPRGVLSFICADRWVANQYGAPLRRLIAESFDVRAYVDLHRASPFESQVIAYPSIFAIGAREKAHAKKNLKTRNTHVHVGSMETASERECDAMRALVKGDAHEAPGIAWRTHATWFAKDEPWIVTSPAQLSALRSLEHRFLPLETHARVGIGVATGNDAIYVVKRDAKIERSRLVPLVMRADISRGKITDSGTRVIDTFTNDGGAIDLEKHPKLSAYLHEHEIAIKRRHVAKKNPKRWFRTIDRVYPELARAPKLLIPDIAGANEVAFDDGKYHPHHNLYFVTSEDWDLEVLGGLLSSKVALFFVWSYAVKMRGRYLRFQAQYLRRIRVPDPKSVEPAIARALRDAFRARDFPKLDELALRTYEIDSLPTFDFVDTRA